MSVKEDWPRPYNIKAWDDNYERAFGKKPATYEKIRRTTGSSEQEEYDDWKACSGAIRDEAIPDDSCKDR